jgi:hypothetical protein
MAKEVKEIYVIEALAARFVSCLRAFRSSKLISRVMFTALSVGEELVFRLKVEKYESDSF